MSSTNRIASTLLSMFLATGVGLQPLVFGILQPRPATALSPVEVKNKAKAKEVTVMIQALENDNFGSGVIVRRSGNTYIVLTANHVVSGSNQFTIRTFDEATYTLKNIQPIPGADMAMVTFESSEVYPTAQIGDSNKLQEAEATFVCGYPKPSAGIPVPLWQITQGNITGLANRQVREGFGEGYAILYSNLTRSGMSGGPVFNDNGELIGIHGKASVKSEDKSWVNQAMPISLYTTASLNQTGNSPRPKRIDPQPTAPRPSSTVAKVPTESGSSTSRIEPAPRPSTVGNSFLPTETSTPVATSPEPTSPVQRPSPKPTQKPVARQPKPPQPVQPPTPARPQPTPEKQVALRPQPATQPEIPSSPSSAPQSNFPPPTRPTVDPLAGIEPYQVALRTVTPARPSAAPQNCRMVEQRINTIVVQKQVCDGLAENSGATPAPEKPAPEKPAPENYVNFGNEEFSKGNFSKAIEQYNRAISAKVDFAEAYFNRGLANGKNGNTRKAVEDFTKAVGLFYSQGKSLDADRAKEILSQLQTRVG